jgi:hypothetical protein
LTKSCVKFENSEAYTAEQVDFRKLEQYDKYFENEYPKATVEERIRFVTALSPGYLNGHSIRRAGQVNLPHVSKTNGDHRTEPSDLITSHDIVPYCRAPKLGHEYALV